jgi:hypothetical protein
MVQRKIKMKQILDYIEAHARKSGRQQAIKDLQTGLYLLNRKNGNKINIEIDGDYGTQTHGFLENACKSYPAQAIQSMIKRAAVSNVIFDTKNNKKLNTERQVEQVFNNFNDETVVLKGGISNVRYVWSCDGDNPCDECAALDGQEFDNLDDVPDRPHPNCQCTVYPIQDKKEDEDEECDCLEDLFDEAEELANDGESLIGEIENAISDLASFLNEKFIEPVRNTIEECIDLLDQIVGTVQDFVQNYQDMKEANTIGADKYFHAKANCDGTQRGELGEEIAKGISDLREWTDYYRNIYEKGMSEAESAKDIYEDQQANEFGRQQGREYPDIPCDVLIDVLRPRGLPDRY